MPKNRKKNFIVTTITLKDKNVAFFTKEEKEKILNLGFIDNRVSFKM